MKAMNKTTESSVAIPATHFLNPQLYNLCIILNESQKNNRSITITTPNSEDKNHIINQLNSPPINNLLEKLRIDHPLTPILNLDSSLQQQLAMLNNLTKAPKSIPQLQAPPKEIDMNKIGIGVIGGSVIGSGAGLLIYEILKDTASNPILLTLACVLIGAGSFGMVGAGLLQPPEISLDPGGLSFSLKLGMK